jgi:hypothetical protein
MTYTVRKGKLVREEKPNKWVQTKPDPAKHAAWDKYYAAFNAKAMELLGKNVDDVDLEEEKVVERALAAEGITNPEDAP